MSDLTSAGLAAYYLSPLSHLRNFQNKWKQIP